MKIKDKKIEEIVAVHFGAALMIAIEENYVTDYVISLRDKCIKELQELNKTP